MRKSLNWGVALGICILLLLIVNVLLTLKLCMDIQERQSSSQKRGPLPCGAIPTRFVIEEPECADKLLRSMNVTNVHVIRRTKIK